MLSISGGRKAGAAASYLVEGKTHEGEREDYYTGREVDGINEKTGQWHGEGAAAFGYTGEVTAQDFKLLAAGFSKNGSALVQNAGDRERVAGHDFTFSAPKSVSIVWGLEDSKTRAEIEKIHHEAVTKALDYLEDKFVSRTGHGGIDRQACQMAVAVFQHGTSREGDADLHSHAFVMNASLRADGGTGSIDTLGGFHYKMAAGALYRAELATGLKAMGYEIERDREFFKIKGMEREVEKEFSKRREQIEAALVANGKSGGRAASAAALDTRKGKEKPDATGLIEGWRERAKELGLDASQLQGLRSEIQKEAQTPSIESDTRAQKVTEALDYATENKAIIRQQDIDKAAFESASWTGRSDSRELAQAARNEVVAVQKIEPEKAFDDRARPAPQLYTTENMIKMEKQIIEQARAISQKDTHSLPATVIEKAAVSFKEKNGFDLSQEQLKAVYDLCQRDLGVLVGNAGTGKSTALEAVRTAYEGAGYTVVGAAPSGKAAAGLESGSGIESKTIDKLLFEIENGKIALNPKTALVLDEAGMVDSRKMSGIVSACEASGAKLILSGDEKQLQPVGAGNTFSHLQNETLAATLTEIHRQRDGDDKQAVQAMSRGDAAAALAHHIDKGRVTIERGDKTAIKTTVEKYIEAAAKVGAPQAVMLASTNAQVGSLNSQAHKSLCEAGKVTNITEFQTLVEFDKSNHQTESKPIEIGENSRMVCTKNNKDTGLRNGDTFTVERVSYSESKIEITVDRTGERIQIEPAKLHLENGYALTTHKAQGLTVDKAIVLGGMNTSRELSYVQSSRARESTEFVFSRKDIGQFQKSLTKDTGEQSKDAVKSKTTMERLADVCKQMSTSKPTPTTLDYERKDSAQIEKQIQTPEKSIGESNWKVESKDEAYSR